MKFMNTWKMMPGCYKATMERFLSSGAPDPEGLTTIGRWHAPGSSYGWHLFEATPAAAAELLATWADVLEMQITPVIEDAEAASSAAKVLGKAS